MSTAPATNTVHYDPAYYEERPYERPPPPGTFEKLMIVDVLLEVARNLDVHDLVLGMGQANVLLHNISCDPSVWAVILARPWSMKELIGMTTAYPSITALDLVYLRGCNSVDLMFAFSKLTELRAIYNLDISITPIRPLTTLTTLTVETTSLTAVLGIVKQYILPSAGSLKKLSLACMSVDIPSSVGEEIAAACSQLEEYETMHHSFVRTQPDCLPRLKSFLYNENYVDVDSRPSAREAAAFVAAHPHVRELSIGNLRGFISDELDEAEDHRYQARQNPVIGISDHTEVEGGAGPAAPAGDNNYTDADDGGNIPGKRPEADPATAAGEEGGTEGTDDSKLLGLDGEPLRWTQLTSLTLPTLSSAQARLAAKYVLANRELRVLRLRVLTGPMARALQPHTALKELRFTGVARDVTVTDFGYIVEGVQLDMLGSAGQLSDEYTDCFVSATRRARVLAGGVVTDDVIAGLGPCTASLKELYFGPPVLPTALTTLGQHAVHLRKLVLSSMVSVQDEAVRLAPACRSLRYLEVCGEATDVAVAVLVRAARHALERLIVTVYESDVAFMVGVNDSSEDDSPNCDVDGNSNTDACVEALVSGPPRRVQRLELPSIRLAGVAALEDWVARGAFFRAIEVGVAIDKQLLAAVYGEHVAGDSGAAELIEAEEEDACIDFVIERLNQLCVEAVVSDCETL